jgi:5-methylcytosine-specific restriction protein B
MSLIWFPTAGDDEHPPGSLLTFVCGTRGLAPDEQILGRPGHARHLHALRRHLMRTCVAQVWTKQDPANLGQPVPRIVAQRCARFAPALRRYGNYIYAAVEVSADDDETAGGQAGDGETSDGKATTNHTARSIVAAFLDLYAWERGWTPLKAADDEVQALRNALRAELFPRVAAAQVKDLLRERRFVILQGPPGTGKTRLADALLKNDFQGRGMTVQFHPAVTYETFVSGISPDVSDAGLRFAVKPGWLLEAVQAARETDGDYLLVIDEINRADLAKVLGEAIYLLEPSEISAGQARAVDLSFKPAGWSGRLQIPENLYILGTMNSADRSTAILDLAVRRRFAFVDMWPEMDVVEEQGRGLAIEAVARLQDIFAQFAPADSLVLMPGHAYFLAETESGLRKRLQFELVPLIREYLVEGRLGPCESELHAYLDWLEGELTTRGPLGDTPG